ENTIIRDAYVRGGPEAAVAAAQGLEARKGQRAQSVADAWRIAAARIAGIDLASGMPPIGTADSTQPGPAGPADRPNQSRSGTIGIIGPGRTVTDTTTGQTHRFKGGDPKDESNWDLVQ